LGGPKKKVHKRKLVENKPAGTDKGIHLTLKRNRALDCSMKKKVLINGGNNKGEGTHRGKKGERTGSEKNVR